MIPQRFLSMPPSTPPNMPHTQPESHTPTPHNSPKHTSVYLNEDPGTPYVVQDKLPVYDRQPVEVVVDDPVFKREWEEYNRTSFLDACMEFPLICLKQGF